MTAVPSGYTVMEDGRIMGPYGKWLAPANHRGTRYVSISDKGVTRSVAVCRIVCEAFHGPAPSAEHDAEHINGDRSDNRAVNLRWGPKPKPGDHQRAERSHRTSLTWDLVRRMRAEYATASITQAALAKRYGVSNGTANNIVCNKTWHDPAYHPTH